ncbi:MAG: replication endonuclease [Sulfurospirillaceae bacterium]|nr:replication endonuclease [Sulfurospirillaceae bacterium]
MYGINSRKRRIALKKVQNTRLFLDNNFVTFDDVTFPLSQFFKNSFVNADRYIAEIQNRVKSIYNYATGRNLVNVFVTLTLPSEYHPKKTSKNGKLYHNPKYNPDFTPRVGSAQLSKYMRQITNSWIYRKIPKDDRCYFRVVEPHKDGTPHIHASFFIPAEFVDDFVKTVSRLFPAPQSSIEKNVNNPVAYLMKYILKTLDDLRFGGDISDLTLWYIFHGICRIYTSRTLISLDVYRVLGGKYSLNELSIMYKEKRLTVYTDPFTNKVISIFDDFGQIWQKKRHRIDYNQSSLGHFCIRKKTNPIPLIIDGYEYEIRGDKIVDLENSVFVPSRAKDLQLYEYYLNLDIENKDLDLKHFALVQNECSLRGLVDCEIQSVDNFNTNIGA